MYIYIYIYISMTISLNKIDIYYLTISENVRRKKHMEEEFKEYFLKEVNPVPYTNINGNFTINISIFLTRNHFTE